MPYVMKVGDLVTRKRGYERIGIVISTHTNHARGYPRKYSKVYWVNGMIDTWSQNCLEVMSESR